MSLTAEDRAIALHLTGERTVPGVPEENYWFRRHEAAYHALVPFCRDAVVLEAGCGEGYGAALLAEHAARVVAIDYDEPTTRHVAKRYPGVGVVRGNLAFLPVRTGSIDVVANLQVIEHLWDQRVSRRMPSGTATGRPLVRHHTQSTDLHPGLRHPTQPLPHQRTLPSELDQLLREAGFTVESLRGLRHGPTGRIGPTPRRVDHRGPTRRRLGSLRDRPCGHAPARRCRGCHRADFELHDDDLDDTLDLIALAVRS